MVMSKTAPWRAALCVGGAWSPSGGRVSWSAWAERSPMNGIMTSLYPRPALRVPGYLSVRAAAERLGICERSVREFC